MPATDATLGYNTRQYYLPLMRTGETLRISWMPLYFASGTGVIYSQTNFSVSIQGTDRTYTAGSVGTGRIAASATGKSYNETTTIRGGGGSAKANRLPLSDLEDTIRLSPGMQWTSVDLHNYDWVLADEDDHDDLSFDSETVTGTGITYSTSSDKVVATTGADEARITIKITAKNASDEIVGDTATLEILCRDIEGVEPPAGSDNGATLPPLPNSFSDPAASLTNLSPTSIQAGFSDGNWTVTNRMSGNLGKVEVDGLYIKMEVTRKDEAGFDAKVLDGADGRFYSHMGRNDNRGFVVKWGARTTV